MSILNQSSTASFYPQWRFRDVSRSDPQRTDPTTILDFPVDFETCKLAARISGGDEDSLIRDYIAAAVQDVEFDAQIKLMTQTLTLYLDAFPAWSIELRTPPIQSVNSIKYLDFAGVQQTYSASLYRVDSRSKPGVVTPAYGTFWPVTYYVTNAVEVEFIAGYTSAALVPPNAKLAIYLRAASRFWNREMSNEETASYDTLIGSLAWKPRSIV